MSVVERCAVCGFTPETRDRATIWRDIARAMIEAREDNPRFYGLRSALEHAAVHTHLRQSLVSEWNYSDTLDKLNASQDVRGMHALFLAHFAETES